MATSTIKGKTGTTLKAVTVTAVNATSQAALTAYLEGNLLKINAVLNYSGKTFANNDDLFTIDGYKAVGRSDFWAWPESGSGLIKAVIMNNASAIKISAVGNCKLTGFDGFYDFAMTIPVVPA